MFELTENIDKLHTTEMGLERIKKNLQIEADDIVLWCKMKILDKDTVIKRIGKNYYAETADVKITVNAYSFTIITAHKISH